MCSLPMSATPPIEPKTAPIRAGCSYQGDSGEGGGEGGEGGEGSEGGGGDMHSTTSQASHSAATVDPIEAAAAVPSTFAWR